MKRRDMEKFLKEKGFWLKRSNKHLIYTNGIKTVAVPNHMDIRSWTVNEIFRNAGI